jgi:hypothetical protein
VVFLCSVNLPPEFSNTYKFLSAPPTATTFPEEAIQVGPHLALIVLII